MTTLVLGGCGFIGGHVVQALLAQGEPVVVLDRSVGRRAPHSGVLASAALHQVQGDLGNHGDLERLFADHAISNVVHLVSSTVPGSSNRDPRFDILTNIGDTVSLLELCVKRAVRKVLFVSSGGAVYGVPRRLPVDEDHPNNPISSYGITKLAIEKYLHLYKHLHGLDYVVIRAANPYGPGQQPHAEQGVIGVFTDRIQRGDDIVIWGDGSVVRDYFHVRDLARLCVLALASPVSGVFNAGSGVGRALSEVIASIEAVVGRRARIRYESGRALDVPRIVLDVSRVRQALGWQAQTVFEDGLAEVLQWLQSRSPTPA